MKTEKEIYKRRVIKPKGFKFTNEDPGGNWKRVRDISDIPEVRELIENAKRYEREELNESS